MLQRTLELDGFLCRMTCFFCGKDFEPGCLKWVLNGQDIDRLPVCDDCGEADSQTLRERLQKYVKLLRNEADMLEALDVEGITTDVSLVQEIMNTNPRDLCEDGRAIHKDGLEYARELIDKGLA